MNSRGREVEGRSKEATYENMHNSLCCITYVDLDDLKEEMKGVRLFGHGESKKKYEI